METIKIESYSIEVKTYVSPSGLPYVTNVLPIHSLYPHIEIKCLKDGFPFITKTQEEELAADAAPAFTEMEGVPCNPKAHSAGGSWFMPVVMIVQHNRYEVSFERPKSASDIPKVKSITCKPVLGWNPSMDLCPGIAVFDGTVKEYR